QPRAVTCRTPGRKDVVRPGAVVAERDRGVRADEDRARVAYPTGDLRGALGLDLQVLGTVVVDELEPLLHVVDEHDRRLFGAQRRADWPGVAVGVHRTVELGLDTTRQRLAVGDEHARREGVVFGLADQVGGHVRRVGRRIGEDRDLGGARLGIDADDTL